MKRTIIQCSVSNSSMQNCKSKNKYWKRQHKNDYKCALQDEEEVEGEEEDFFGSFDLILFWRFVTTLESLCLYFNM
eukprot:m.36019 g.36019  ORF g.36019 m.36019 type:complete len:76 (-) comp10067_c0_seq2:341-568(-)